MPVYAVFPVEIRVDIDRLRDPADVNGSDRTVATRFIDQAVLDTPTPAGLFGTPLQRLTGEQPAG